MGYLISLKRTLNSLLYVQIYTHVYTLPHHLPCQRDKEETIFYYFKYKKIYNKSIKIKKIHKNSRKNSLKLVNS